MLELGAGTALPGILCALCEADVILSDSGKLPHCLEQCRKSIELNGLKDKVKVVGITWGLFLRDIIQLRERVDLILGSDCFFDPIVFEDLISTIAYLLGNNHSVSFCSKFICGMVSSIACFDLLYYNCRPSLLERIKKEVRIGPLSLC